MIEVSFEDDKIVLRGHAGANGPEADRVCAAASMLTQTWWISRNMTPPETSDGVSWIYADESDDTLFVLTGLGLLALNYPDNISVEEDGTPS